MDALAARLRDRIRAEDGYSLVELLIVLAILGVVVGGLTQLFTSGANSEIDQNNRVQSQQQARVGLDRLRREAHCASGVSFSNAVGSSYSTITLTLPSYCIRTTLTSAVSIGTSGLSAATISVVSTTGFASGANTISFGNSTYQVTVSCTGTTSTSFTGCSGGTAVGQTSTQSYASGSIVTNGSSSTVTWCAAGGSAPYSLKRYVGGSCSGTGTTWASYLTSNAVFAPYAIAAATASVSTSGGGLGPGNYFYEITSVKSGVEEPGTVTSTTTITSGTANKITLTWSSTGANSYNVYGRDSSGLRLLGNVTSTSYTDYGPAYTTGSTALTVPSSGTYTINASNTGSFSGSNISIQLGASGPVAVCGGVTSSSFTNCTGSASTAGTYQVPTYIYGYSTVRPPSTTLAVTLNVDKGTVQQFTLTDNVVLRNSRPF